MPRSRENIAKYYQKLYYQLDRNDCDQDRLNATLSILTYFIARLLIHPSKRFILKQKYFKYFEHVN